MIDKIENVGSFIELEILAKDEEEKERLHNELNLFIEKMECKNLREKKMPYRDIVKEHKNNQIKIIYFVHGTTTDNADKLCSGWKEAMLNELGKEQAQNLGNVIKEKEIKKV